MRRTTPKLAKAPVRQPKPERASNVSREEFLRHFRACASLRGEVDEANGRYRAAIKAAGEAGIDEKSLVQAIKIRKSGDEAKEAMRFRDLGRYLRYLDMPLGHQFALFEEEAPAASAPDDGDGDEYADAPDDLDGERDEDEQAVWDATQAGRRAGRGGERRSANPHLQGTKSYVAWDEGWLNGQASLADEMTPAAGTVN